MIRNGKTRAKILLGEFSRFLGNETLRVRIYQDRRSRVCEREVVERDGTSFVIVLPFQEVAGLREVLAEDPHFIHVRADVERMLSKVASALRVSDATASTSGNTLP